MKVKLSEVIDALYFTYVLSYKNKEKFYELINNQKDGDILKNNMIIYVSKDGDVKVDVKIKKENIWMSKDVMANIYDTT